jgi:phosphohistidine phosphatase
MDAVRTLWLMRHAKAADFVPGRRDVDRPLTDRGHAQSAAAGRWLAGRSTPPEVVLCSPSVRTRQTTADLGLAVAPTDAPGVWEAGPDDLAAELAQVDDDVRTVLVVGHAPGIPALVDQLTDRSSSPADLVTELDRHFPTATIAELRLADGWSDLRPGRLVALHLEH